ncbi:MerR family transcriptional regulator [Thermocatellispora tengchongensis]
MGIGEAAALYDLAPSTLRWWERQGVLTPSDRNGAQRLYREDDLRRLGLAYLCRVVGMMPLEGTAVVTSGRTDVATWRNTIREEIARLEERIERASAARDYLRHLLQCEDDDITRCSLLDAELATHTPVGRARHPDLVTAARAARRSRAAAPPRDEKRDGPCDENPAVRVCPGCGRPIPPATRGRPRAYCSHACRQRAYRTRRGTAPTG